MFDFLSKRHEHCHANFENVQYAMKHRDQFMLINTLPLDSQKCLIKGTVLASDEEKLINEMVYNIHITDKKIIVYGKNDSDITVQTKYDQLLGLGIECVYKYNGGMFEWLLLQDIYGSDEFLTTSTELDILQFRPTAISHYLPY